ncbi:MAG: hypothetical protein ABIH49_01140 [archaeon]
MEKYEKETRTHEQLLEFAARCFRSKLEGEPEACLSCDGFNYNCLYYVPISKALGLENGRRS